MDEERDDLCQLRLYPIGDPRDMNQDQHNQNRKLVFLCPQYKNRPLVERF